MNKKGYAVIVMAFALFSIVWQGCQTDRQGSSLTVRIRLPNEPDCLHPIYSKSAYAVQIESLIMLPAAEYDPVSLTLSPLLIEEIPQPSVVTSGPYQHDKVYHLQFRPEAVWADGKPVTAEDYLFTVKTVYNPYVLVPSYTSFLDFIHGISPDPSDPKKVSVYVDSSYILGLETVVNFNIYPSHVYDPEQIMSEFSLEQLRDTATRWTPEQDTLLKKFATAFESPKYLREIVTGSGPYELASWTTGEYIHLKRKSAWWGDQIKDRPMLLHAYPEEIHYRIILDAAAAEAAMKAGEIDLMAEVPAADFVSLREDAKWKNEFQFLTPQLMQVNYLELNTRDSILADRRIRQALAYSIDYKGILDNVMKGLASRTVGPIHPQKPYFDSDLQPIQQDLNRSMALIREAGWSDTNGNGIPDKKIGGKLEELQLNIEITNKEEGNTIANIVKSNAAKAGFDIQIKIVDPSQMTQDIKQRHFEITPIRLPAYPNADDPFPIWHSTSDRPGGSNRSGFHSPALDSAIVEIRTASTPESRNSAYRRFQEIIYEAQPSIFLYVPLERIIASRRVELITSSRRPGYFENLMKPAG